MATVHSPMCKEAKIYDVNWSMAAVEHDDDGDVDYLLHGLTSFQNNIDRTFTDITV